MEVWLAGQYAVQPVSMMSETHATIRIVYVLMQRQLRSISSESDLAAETGEGDPLLFDGFDIGGEVEPGT